MSKRLLTMLVLLAAVVTGAWAQAQTYKVTLQEGTEDATNWTVPEEAAEGATVTVTYKGEKKVKSVKAVKAAPVDLKAVPLTIEAITAGNISVSSPKEGMQYSLNGGAKTTMTANPTTIEVAVGDKVQFYGKGTTIICYDGTVITGSGDDFTCKVYGNIMSLVDEENFATATTLSQSFTFFELFYENTTLTDASSLLLPAETLANGCYRQMFWGCTALTAAPALPAETLVTSCYNQMFRGCTSLTTAPVLPAPTLVTSCYYNMFYGCSKLATVTCRATSGFNATMCTENWLKNAGTQAEGTKTFNAVSTAEWPSGNAGIPDGWTRVNVDN